MGPRSSRDGQRMEQTCTGLIRRFVTGTDGAGRDVLTSVSVHGGPPESTLEHGEGVRYPWVAGQVTGVRPLEYSGTAGVRNKQGVWGATSRVRLLLLGLGDGGLDLPGETGQIAGWQDGFWFLGGLLLGVEAG